MMGSNRWWVVIFLGVVIWGTPTGGRAAGLAADWVFHNGKILTANSEDPARFRIVQAVAIYDGKFVVVGSNEEALATAGSNSRRIDLNGRTVLPGLIETHLHVQSQTAGHYLQFGIRNTAPPIPWTTKEEGLAQLRTLALTKKTGDWIIVNLRRRGIAGTPLPDEDAPSLQELDTAAPNNPLSLVIGNDDPIMANSLALGMLLKRYPDLPGVEKGADGKPNGLLVRAGARTIPEFWPELSRKRVEELAPFYKKELEEVAARGGTTVATRVDIDSMRMYYLLDVREEMPIRLSYGTQMATYSPLADVIFRRVAGQAGHGSPWLWLSGAAPGPNEYGSGPNNGDACIYGKYDPQNENFPNWREQPWGTQGDCRITGYPGDTIFRDSLLAAARNGWAITNTHIAGDKGLDDYLSVLEEADRKYGIADMRWSADHCRYITEEQAQRAKRLGMSLTCAMVAPLEDAEKGVLGAYTAIYDRERAADSVVPYRRLVRLGMKPSTHCESHRGWAFTCMQYAVTRKDKVSGQIWGPQQRIDRRESLYTFTRWAAWHAWKEKYIGSIEVGKWADLVVIDRDYLTVPEDEIAQANPLLTVVGGKISYSEPAFASSLGLPTVGFQAPPDWWER